MKAIRGMMYLSVRGYRYNRGSTSAKRFSEPPNEIDTMHPEMPGENFLTDELENPDDLDEYESDFMNVGKYDKMHQREMEVKKAKLMTQIVKRKYFKSEEPAMLTWGEKEQIRLLHSQDPVEWTPDKLSDSFPASRDAVLKILRAKWPAKFVKVVEKYEKNVKENWNLLRAGKLAIDPQLEAHLAKFKNRDIKTTDPEIIAKKILQPKPVFPKPRSTLFSNIIQSHLDENPDSEADELPDREASKNKSLERIESKESKERSQQLAFTTKLASERDKISQEKSLTLDQFLQNHVERVKENDMTLVDRVLVDELKQQSTEAYKTKSLMFESASPVGAWNEQDETKERLTMSPKGAATLVSEKNASMVREEGKKKDLAVSEASIKPELANILKGSIETGIIARQKTEGALQDNYPDFIRIPHKKYKPGATYRVQDRYYDDNGELLYRVPGLKV